MSYKSPLSVYVVWHPSFKKGREIADHIYASFSRDTDNPLERGIGIPVFYRSVAQKSKTVPIDIPLEASDYNAILLLVDDHLFNDDAWNSFVKGLLPRLNSKFRIFPVAFSANSFYFEETSLGKKQFLDLRPKNNEFEKDEFSEALKTIRSRVLHGLCRLMLEKRPLHEANEEVDVPQPIKLFISHAKKDNEKEAEDFRDYVRSKTKLSTFFDANDIADGYRFDTQIKRAIQDGQAALVVFHSDAYSERDWCQIEILTAKRYKAPIVVVHNIKKGENRSFPYLGNVPSVRFLDNNFDDIIDLTLHQVLTNVYHQANLKKITTLYMQGQFNGIELSSPPELFNFLDILSIQRKSKGGSFIALYPDPPLGISELSVLTDMNNKIDFLTPVELSKLVR